MAVVDLEGGWGRMTEAWQLRRSGRSRPKMRPCGQCSTLTGDITFNRAEILREVAARTIHYVVK